MAVVSQAQVDKQLQHFLIELTLSDSSNAFFFLLSNVLYIK